ncbi:MAG: DUF5721 family protein [Lachnospiraceae bacterium]|nr:DUF5721 family protein [Lachnospiraceae bacterium]
MRLFKITNVKQFMNKLLVEGAFDSFLVSEVLIKTGNSYVIDGHLNKDFFSEDELNVLRSEAESNGRIFHESLSRFSELKPLVFSIMKGKKTPVSFKMSFYLAEENVIKLLASSNTSFTKGDIDGLSIIVKYSEGELTVTSTASLKIFSLDKSLEKYFDDMVNKFLTSQEFQFEIM